MTYQKEHGVLNMSEKNIDIICPNRLITFFNPMALLVYCLSQIAFKYETECVTWLNIAYLMRCSTPVQTKKRAEITSALDDLCDLGFIEKNKDWGYIINTRSFYNQKDGFEKCSYETLTTLRNNAALFQHYMIIKKGLINGKCTYNINYFAKIENVSNITISRRNKELVEKKLIYIYRPAINSEENKYDKNVYMLYNSKYENRENYGNLNRSVVQRYNHFVKHPEKFTPLERKTLRKQVEEYNARNPDRVKDLSVFST